MKIYFTTWNQLYTHTGLFLKNKIELQIISVGILTDCGGVYIALNKQMDRAQIISSELGTSVSDMLRKPFMYPVHNPLQIRNTIFDYCNEVNDDEGIEIIGYEKNGDTSIFRHIMRNQTGFPNLLDRRIIYRNLVDDELEVADLIPDDVYASLESPFGYTMIRADSRFTLRQKKIMLVSHTGYPKFNNTDSLLAHLKSLEKLDLLLTALKEQYAY